MKAMHEFQNEQQWLEYLRFYYTGQAMHGLLSQHIKNTPEDISNMVVGYEIEPVYKSKYISIDDNCDSEELARDSVSCADALIEALNKPKQ